MLEQGAMLPDVALTDADGADFSLARYRGKPVVVYFYPKADTPGCTSEAKDFTEELTTQVSRQLVDTTLIGTSTRLAHVSEDDPQQYFALVCLQPEAFIGAFEKMNELNGKQRQALKRRAALEFEDLDNQLQKLKE